MGKSGDLRSDLRLLKTITSSIVFFFRKLYVNFLFLMFQLKLDGLLQKFWKMLYVHLGNALR